MPEWRPHLFALLAPCIIKQAFETARNLGNLKKIICSYITAAFGPQQEKIRLFEPFLFLFCHDEIFS